MEHSIGVGIIVALTFASSVYIWNNDNFSGLQKTVLLICLIFPPVQWLGILIISIYNGYRKNNSVEGIEERKVEVKKQILDSSISNLKDLKEKGILSEEEYKMKVDKIEVAKQEQALKNSQEYKQLKNLLDSGILTKEEFESKTNLLQNDSTKLGDNIETKEVIKPPTKDYIKPANKKNKIVIITSLMVIIITVILIYVNNRNYSNDGFEDSEKETEYTPTVLDVLKPFKETDEELKNRLNGVKPTYQEPVNIKKYAYITTTISYPKLKTFMIDRGFDSNMGYSRPVENHCYIEWKNETYISDILFIENYNEDVKYMYFDKFENELKLRYHSDSNFLTTLINECLDSKEREKIKNEDYSAKATDRQIFTFDSYSEASISKQNLTSN